MTRPRAVLAMGSTRLRDELFGPDGLRRLGDLVDLHPGVVTALDDAASRDALGSAEILVTGWGVPRLDRAALALAPDLRAIIHGAGTVKVFLDPWAWERGIQVSSAVLANARPVAEYTVAMIVLAGKRVLAQAAELRAHEGLDGWQRPPGLGNYGKTVGIVGASRIGRLVMELLRTYDLDVVVSDPCISAEDAAACGARLVTLDELVRVSDIVSLHAPAIESTRNMMGADQLARMKDGATLINTARGSLLDHDALVAELDRGRLHAVLDVTEPEPLPSGHPLYRHPSVLLTPHVAGSLGTEVRRLGSCVLGEVERYVAGERLRYPVLLAELGHSA